MAWDEIKFENLSHSGGIYKLSLFDTGFNLLFQIYWFEKAEDYDNEAEGYRVFFGINYWPAIREILLTITPANKEGFVPWGNKRIKIELLRNTIILSRQASDKSGGEWNTEEDDTKRRGGTEKSLTFTKKLINNIVEIFDRLLEASIYLGVRTSDWDAFYPDQMVNHDQSMIALKIFLENDEDYQMFVKAGVDPEGKERIINKIKFYEEDVKKPFEDREYKKIDPYHRAMITQWNSKLKRSEFSEMVVEHGIAGIVYDTRGDDGYIQLTLGEEVYKINFDWEIRNDWIEIHKNVPIYFNRRNYVKENPAYCAIGNIVLAPTIPEKAYKSTVKEVEKLINDVGGGSAPYFLYDEMGQFQRKIDKQSIMLSIQCSKIAPFWPDMDKIPKNGYLITAWHEDFGELEKVIRTAGTKGRKEKSAGIFKTTDYGLFEFNEAGIKHFGDIIKKQYKTGTITDYNGNTIPKVRKWS